MFSTLRHIVSQRTKCDSYSPCLSLFETPQTKTDHLLCGVAGCATGSTRPLSAHLMPNEYLSLYHIESRSPFFLDAMRSMGDVQGESVCCSAYL